MSQTHEATRASLILRLKNADDVAAWDEFVAIYSPVIRQVARKRGLQTADADNLSQEVCLSVANSISNWLERPNRGKFRAWLIRIARNQAVDILTKRATRRLGLDGSEGEKLLRTIPDRQELSGELDLEYERNLFRWACKQVQGSVAEHTWDAFRLSSIDGVSVDEVASRLDTRVGNVYLARSRVMARIRELVSQYEESS